MTEDDPNRTFIVGGAQAPPSSPSASGDPLTPELIEKEWWDDSDVVASGMPVSDTFVLSIGGGLGSFALADTLRVFGLGTNALTIVGDGENPTRTYRYLARNSQIPNGERLRSDAGSTMDNIWGFPSYAWREAVRERTVRPLLNVFGEPFSHDYYTPRAGHVYESVDKEAERIGWSEMIREGRVRIVRRRRGGGYFTVLNRKDSSFAADGLPVREVIRSRHVHIAVGYPGVKFLPDLQKYRETFDERTRVVNAYEPHDQVYEECRRRPSTVLVRGSGIVGSRILQRLLDDRELHGAQTSVIHLFRNYISEPQGDSVFFRRPAENGWAYQGFNFPKSAWGGQLKEKLESLEGAERVDFIRQLGGTNTAPRKSWKQQLQRGRDNGWYREFVGTVQHVQPGPNQSIDTTIKDKQGALHILGANFIIDATGLDADIGENSFLNDLLERTGARRSDFGRLDVAPSFEVRGTRSDPGRLYASGSITLGGYYAGVDSFLGLQYAALAIADDLAGSGEIPPLTPTRSAAEWWRWFSGRSPKEVAA